MASEGNTIFVQYGNPLGLICEHTEQLYLYNK